jgi:Protein of unknown function (DUF2934)
MAPVQEVETVELMPESVLANTPTPEQIAALAYQLWQQRGCPDGSPDVDWLKAEAELMAKHS